MPETKPQLAPHLEQEEHESMLQTFGGYFKVMRDRPYVAFLVASMLMGIVYQQMYNSLSVFLRDNHGIDPQRYGFLMSSSAITVVIFQFSVTRTVKRWPPFLAMAIGVLFYMIGFTMFGFVSAYMLFISAIVIITIGEMIIMPVSSALTANFAPVDMRGRYMAVFGLSWALPATIGPAAAGIILDNFNPNLLWYIGGALTAVSALGFYLLHLRFRGEPRFAPGAHEGAAAAEAAAD
jgi:MFS family permease